MTTRSLKSAALLLLLMGCGPKTPPSTSAGIVVKAAEGGVVGEGPGAQLTVPAGALSKDASIKVAIQPPDTHAVPGVKAIGPVWSFQVDGAEHHRFSKPVKIALPVDPSLRVSGSPVGISAWSGDRWQSVPGAHLDAASGKAVAEVDHFSLYVPHQESSPDPVKRANED